MDVGGLSGVQACVLKLGILDGESPRVLVLYHLVLGRQEIYERSIVLQPCNGRVILYTTFERYSVTICETKNID